MAIAVFSVQGHAHRLPLKEIVQLTEIRSFGRLKVFLHTTNPLWHTVLLGHFDENYSKG